MISYFRKIFANSKTKPIIAMGNPMTNITSGPLLMTSNEMSLYTSS